MRIGARVLEGAVVTTAYLALALAFAWPALSADGPQLWFAPDRFDGYGTAWLGEHAWRALTGSEPWTTSTAVAWPVGLDLRSADSFLFCLLYLPFRLLMPPEGAFDAFCVVALATTGTGGWWMARHALGTGRLAALGAGVIVAFNSASHTFRIEGEAYLLAGVFLPLMAGFLVRTVRGGALSDAAGAGLCMGLLAWSSGYFAVDGALLAVVLVGLLVGTGQARPLSELVKPLVVAGLAAFVLAGPWAWMVLGAIQDGARVPTGEDPLVNAALDSASFTGLLFPLPETAHLRQGRIAYLGLAGLAMAAGAVGVRGARKTLPWSGLVVVGTVLCLGPWLRVDDAAASGLTLPYAWLVEHLPAVRSFRMPLRFQPIAFVGLAALAALWLDQLRQDGLGAPWRVALVALLVLDASLFVGFAVDRSSAPADVPSVYDVVAKDKAVLDLWGYDADLLKRAGLAAWYQVHHDRPVMDDFTDSGGPGQRFSRALALSAARGRDDDVDAGIEALRSAGIGGIVIHAGTFLEDDAERLEAALGQRCARASVELEHESAGSEHIVYAIKGASPADDPAAAASAITAWLETVEPNL